MGEIWGRFLDEKQLSRIHSPLASQRIGFFIPGLQTSPAGVVRVTTRGGSMTGAANCQPRLIVDGIRYPGDLPLNTLVSGDAIRALGIEPVVSDIVMRTTEDRRRLAQECCTLLRR